MNFKELTQSHPLVLVDFFAEWCGPCKMVPPILDEVKKTLGTKIKIVKIDVDKNPSVSGSFQIRSIPTMVLFRNGSPVWRQSGVVPANDLIALIKNSAE